MSRFSDDLSSDLLLPPETVEIRREARAFADEVLRPLAHELNCTPERMEGFRWDVFKAIARAGLYEIPFEKDVGGGNSSATHPVSEVRVRFSCRGHRDRSDESGESCP